MSPEVAVDSDDLARFAEATQSALSEDPSMSARAAELRVTQPLLETLGWDLRGGAVVPEYRAADVTVGFALRANGAPRALVETVAPAVGATSDDGDRLVAAMNAADVDRGLLIDGHTVAVAVGPGDGSAHSRIEIADLPEYDNVLARFTPEGLADDERAVAASRLADRRDSIREAVAGRLVEATDGRCEDALHDAADAFLVRLVEELGSSVASPRTASDSESDPVDEQGETGAIEEPADPPEQTAEEEEDRDGETGATPENGDEASVEPDEAADSDREFVVRFFDGGARVGAVGGSTPLSALLQTAELLERQRAALRGLSTPWRPDEDERAVLRDEPTSDGSYRELPTGHYLRTDLQRAETRTTVEGLTEDAGLRVMFQGDW